MTHAVQLSTALEGGKNVVSPRPGFTRLRAQATSTDPVDDETPGMVRGRRSVQVTAGPTADGMR